MGGLLDFGCKFRILNKDNMKLKKFNQEETIKKDIEQIKSGNYISKIDKYFNEFYDKQSTLLEYLNDNYLIILDEISKIEARQRNILQDNSNLIKNLIESLKNQTYNKELYDIYVIADNCTDNTARIARDAGAIVYERFDETKKTKGYALDWFLQQKIEENADYDALFLIKISLKT